MQNVGYALIVSIPDLCPLSYLAKNIFANPNHRFAYLCLDNDTCISMKTLIEIYHAVQEL